MTHHANRQRRRKAARIAVAGPEDLARYGRLVEACRRAAREIGGEAKAVARARKGVRGRPLPSGQAVVGGVFDQLCRLADRWPGMSDAARAGVAGAMAALADEAGGVLAALTGERPARPRADIDG